MRKLDQSYHWSKRAAEVIAHSALTNSKRPESFVRGVYPTHLERGHGCKVIDVDGNQYIDYICGLGTNLLGYSFTPTGSAPSLSLSTRHEVELAEKLKNLFPYMERMRFLKSGSEGCSAAIRIARAATGRNEIASDGYHGWHDEFVSLTPPANGVAGLHKIFPMGAYWKQFPQDFAAVIIEPVVTDASELRIQWLRELRKKCDETGTLLIFDEVITALRFPGLSVAKWCGVEPDITVMGKALAGGLPLSVVGGRKKYMEADYFVSSTFAGETLSIAAAMAVLDQVKRQDVIENLWLNGGKFIERFNNISPDLVSIEGYNTRGVFRGRDELTTALFMQECVKAGVLFGPSWFYCTEHYRYDDQVLSICQLNLRRIRNNEVKLEGDMPVKPFAQRVRDT
jgi:glutamate-1-semialdehyde 2,1-aminomutase